MAISEVQRAKKVRAHIRSYFDGSTSKVMSQLSVFDYMSLKNACKQMVSDGFFDIYYVEQAKTLRQWGYPEYTFPKDNERIWKNYEKEVAGQLYYMAREYIALHPGSQVAKAFGRRL